MQSLVFFGRAQNKDQKKERREWDKRPLRRYPRLEYGHQVVSGKQRAQSPCSSCFFGHSWRSEDKLGCAIQGHFHCCPGEVEEAGQSIFIGPGGISLVPFVSSEMAAAVPHSEHLQWWCCSLARSTPASPSSGKRPQPCKEEHATVPPLNLTILHFHWLLACSQTRFKELGFTFKALPSSPPKIKKISELHR